MRTAGLIVAAGRGQRLGGEMPKQYLPLGRQAVLRRAVAALLAHPGVDLVQVVIHPDDRALCAAALAGLDDPRLLPPVDGGASRSDSVLAGLEALAPAAPDRVLIHDAARPFLPPRLVSAVLDALDDPPGRPAGAAGRRRALARRRTGWRRRPRRARASGGRRRRRASASPRSSPPIAPAPATRSTTPRSRSPPASTSGWSPATRTTSRSPPRPTSTAPAPASERPWTSAPATASTCTPSAPATG